jgi:hypothetical protein
MKQDWLDVSLRLAREPADFYSGARKILRNRHFTFRVPDLDPDTLTMQDCGFTKSKMSMLRRNYLNQESVDAGLQLWAGRIVKNKYGSVGVSTYNHYMKGDVKGATPRGSVMGPCIQSFTLTLLNDKQTSVDIFYRTTELFKKYPADLVFLRDVLLEPFKFPGGIKDINFHFANITCHPMYFVTLIPHLDDPCKEMDRIKAKDKHFFDWLVKWTARYVCPEHSRGIQKFAQALRVQMDAQARIPKKMMRDVQAYLRKNHPGHRNSYQTPEEDEE